MNIAKLLLSPVITESSTIAAEQNNQYQFKVDKAANKHQIKQAIESMFNVTIEKIQTINVKPKTRRFGRKFGKTAAWKKAIVTLQKGQKIEFVKGV